MISLEQLTSGKQDQKNKGKRSGGFTRGQNFSFLKHSTNSKGGRFQFANDFWDQYDLNKNGFFQSDIKDESGKIVEVYLGLVSDKEERKELKPTILNHTGKGDTKTNQITSNVLEEGLRSIGVLKEVSDADIVENKPVHQYIKLEKVEGLTGDGLIAVFKLVSDPEGGSVKAADNDDSQADAKAEEPANEMESEEKSAEEEVADAQPTKAASSLMDDY